jgi:hypothetical protein
MQKYSTEADFCNMGFSLLSFSSERQLIRDVSADGGFLCDKAIAL